MNRKLVVWVNPKGETVDFDDADFALAHQNSWNRTDNLSTFIVNVKFKR